MKCMLLWGMAISLVGVVGCGGDTEVRDVSGDDIGREEATVTRAELQETPSDEPSVPALSPPSAEDREQAESAMERLNSFGLDLYPHLAEGDENVCYSPASLGLLLTMTYAGTRGETAAELGQVLHLPEGVPDAPELHGAYQSLTRVLGPGKNDNYELGIANALWPRIDRAPNELFVSLLNDYYAAELHALDFGGDPGGATETINDWASQRTRGKIPQLLEPGIIDPMTVLVLTNAVYFKGVWAEEFVENVTKDARFWVTPEESVTTAMMYQYHEHGYFENEALQALQMHFRGGYAMTVLLPKIQNGLADLEARLPEQLPACLAGFETRSVKVYLPRFEFATGYQFKETLKAMGAVSMFDPEKADLSGMLTPGTDVYISHVLQKAYIKVDEKGAEAAAASAAIATLESAVAPQEEPPTFRADHPFVWLVRHRSSGTILFMGRVMDPSAA